MNLNKSSPATEATLQAAVEMAVDLLVVQEPWLISTNKDFTLTRSINHPSFYQLFPPLVSRSTRPRVMIYVSKQLKAEINNIPNPSLLPDPDFQLVKVKSLSFSFYLCNIYNQTSSSMKGKAIERQLLLYNLPPSSLLLGDFNIHHPWWDPLSLATPTASADNFQEWLEDHQFSLLNTPGTGTFFRPNMEQESVLDLSFATQDLVARVEDWTIHPDIGSDHYAISFTIQALNGNLVESPLSQARFNTKKVDWDRFNSKLASAISQSTILSTLEACSLPTLEDSTSLLLDDDSPLALKLDSLGQDLTDIILQACYSSMSLIKPRAKAKAWWSLELTSLRKAIISSHHTFLRELARTPLEDTLPWKN